VIGELAASLDLVPAGSRLSAAELAAGLQAERLERALAGSDARARGTCSGEGRQA
jgi:hypothetical protein